MSLIFDGFADLEHAQSFEQAVKERYPNRRTHIWMSQDEMEDVWVRHRRGLATPGELAVEMDAFPWQLDPPIVLVSRVATPDHWETDARIETSIESLVKRFGGVFAGT